MQQPLWFWVSAYGTLQATAPPHSPRGPMMYNAKSSTEYRTKYSGFFNTQRKWTLIQSYAWLIKHPCDLICFNCFQKLRCNGLYRIILTENWVLVWNNLKMGVFWVVATCCWLVLTYKNKNDTKLPLYLSDILKFQSLRSLKMEKRKGEQQERNGSGYHKWKQIIMNQRAFLWLAANTQETRTKWTQTKLVKKKKAGVRTWAN